jgi:hypothetical protein
VAVDGSLEVGSVILANLSPAWSDFETQLDFGIEAALDQFDPWDVEFPQ